MNEEYIIKKCNSCGTTIRVLKNNCDSLTCCGELMVECVPNTVDAAVEKHKPEVVIDGDKINVTVNHVMEDDHYIEWISISIPGKREKVVYLNPGDVAKATFCYVPGSKVYAYCNKHGLWMTEVK